jgi:hypothetical protein
MNLTIKLSTQLMRRRYTLLHKINHMLRGHFEKQAGAGSHVGSTVLVHKLFTLSLPLPPPHQCLKIKGS